MKYLKKFESKNDINWNQIYGLGLINAIDFDSNVSKVRDLIKQGADINFKDSDNITPLIIAIKKERHEIIDYLIKNGADINYQDDDGMTPLMHAGEVNSFTILQELIKADADWNIYDDDDYDFFDHTPEDCLDMIKVDYPEKI